MCVNFMPSFEFTEAICESCIEAEHDTCDDWTEEACACRNSEHALDNRGGLDPLLWEKFIKVMSET